MAAAMVVLGARSVAENASAAPSAVALLAAAREALGRAQSLEADVEHHGGGRVIRGKVALKRPNLARLELDGLATGLLVSDGTRLYTYYPRRNEYDETATPSDDSGVSTTLVPQIRAFFDSGRSLVIPPGGAAQAHRETIGGVVYDVVEITHRAGARPGAPARRERICLGLEDHLPRRMLAVAGPGIETEAILSHVRINGLADAARFRWTAPAGARRMAPQVRRTPERNLLPIGAPAPDFQLPTPVGDSASLSQVCRRNRLTLVTFWFYG